MCDLSTPLQKAAGPDSRQQPATEEARPKKAIHRRPRRPTLSPLIQFALDEADRQGYSLADLSGFAGYDVGTMHRWRRGVYARVTTLEDILNILGYTLTITKKEPNGPHSDS